MQRLLAAGAGAVDLHLRRYAPEWVIGLVASAVIVATGWFLLGAPRPFPAGAVVVVPQGASARSAATLLAEADVVREPVLLEFFLRATGEGASIRPGAYRFAGPENLVAVALRLARGAYGIPSVRITFPEGSTVLDMANKIAKVVPGVSASDFISAAGPYEGYLFPDTYTFQPSDTAAAITDRMQQNFVEKTAPLAPDIAASGHSLSDIVIMASIIEREAARPADRAMVAGILWNRIRLGMPLQVDAVFGYINSRATYSPSFRDLAVDSPYNTYLNKGLPPGAISNPGLSALEAALHPAKTSYLYYLTGRDGLMHYSKTYAGQLANEHAYLN
ncbi:MAG: endolytic transglycosylase MltG [Patescibacteria group bacterium]|nr:endolytic transglycosylase MltG [Patescibacteria group bacterium]MDE1943891.1 endolytic transglycosylase MltG [Patescibacteria group bacterium]MDE1945183.1 endolytic transglycosylase MltG [Patescibacteria group bacterium]MDE2057424.1 endolytic transglycosylase MltG [Patescibacteria group bacterium]